MAEGLEQGPPPRGQITALSDVSAENLERISCGFAGLDKIMGLDESTGNYGFAAKAGHAIQLCGPPGSGKSSILLQACMNITKQRYSVLYVAGEESLQQIKSRADRFGKFNHKMNAVEESDLDGILSILDDEPPEFIIVDSINTLSVEDYTPGSTAAITVAAKEIYAVTKAAGICLILVVQMNKVGDNFAGPRALEHAMDTSLIMSVERDGIRLISSVKNRYGIAPAQQRFEMRENGLFEIDEPAPPEPKAKPPTEPTTPNLILVP
jgi:DNA repair protein RadA/Sms